MVSNKYGKWQTLKSLTPGGQAEVFLVLDTSKPELLHYDTVFNWRDHEQYRKLSGSGKISYQASHVMELMSAVIDAQRHVCESLFDGFCPDLHVLKAYSENATHALKGRERLIREVRALDKITHNNIVRVVDSAPDGSDPWYVTEHYKRGALDNERNVKMFYGRPVEAISAFRALVEGVKTLHDHENSIIHRDIKTSNVLVSHDGSLCLADFGIVYFKEDGSAHDSGQNGRLTVSGEKVGTTHWMPPWVLDPDQPIVHKPSFDIYSLGKLLWCMIAGRAKITDQTYNPDSQHGLSTLFPQQSEAMNVVYDKLLKDTVVQVENKCLHNCETLLTCIDETLNIIRRPIFGFKNLDQALCVVCGVGHYEPLTDFNEHPNAPSCYGLQPQTGHMAKLIQCRHCGNVMWFKTINGQIPKAFSS